MELNFTSPRVLPARRGLFGNWWWHLQGAADPKEPTAPLDGVAYAGVWLKVEDPLRLVGELDEWLSAPQ